MTEQVDPNEIKLWIERLRSDSEEERVRAASELSRISIRTRCAVRTQRLPIVRWNCCCVPGSRASRRGVRFLSTTRSCAAKAGCGERSDRARAVEFGAKASRPREADAACHMRGRVYGQFQMSLPLSSDTGERRDTK